MGPYAEQRQMTKSGDIIPLGYNLQITLRESSGEVRASFKTPTSSGPPSPPPQRLLRLCSEKNPFTLICIVLGRGKLAVGPEVAPWGGGLPQVSCFLTRPPGLRRKLACRSKTCHSKLVSFFRKARHLTLLKKMSMRPRDKK